MFVPVDSLPLIVPKCSPCAAIWEQRVMKTAAMTRISASLIATNKLRTYVMAPSYDRT